MYFLYKISACVVLKCLEVLEQHPFGLTFGTKNINRGGVFFIKTSTCTTLKCFEVRKQYTIGHISAHVFSF